MVGPVHSEVEASRLRILQSYDVLDTAAEPAFDDITHLASTLCDTPIALISFVDAERQWFKSKFGLDVNQTDRRHAFCAHAIMEPDSIFVVRDALKDSRFADNPLVVGEPYIRFYAGAPIIVPSGYALGTVCVIDREPRELDEKLQRCLCALANQVATILEYRSLLAELDAHSANQDHRIASLLSAMRFGILFEDNASRIEYANPALRRLWRLPPEIPLAGRPTSDLIELSGNTGTVPSQFADRLLKQPPKGQSDTTEIGLSDGRTLTQLMHPVRDIGGKLIGRLWIYEDVTREKQTAENLAYLAERDPLTGLCNRHRFQEELHKMVSQAHRFSRSAAVLFFDLDEFKHVNDSFGHGVGDTLLVRIAGELRPMTRRNETLARLGGDEFAVLLPEAVEQDAIRVASRISRAISSIPFQAQGRVIRVTVSIGIALYPTHGTSAEELVAHADSAMYQAKQAGKNGWRVYRADLDRSSNGVLALGWNERISRAIEQNQITIQFQGIHDRAGKLRCAEALVRIKDPAAAHGVLMPSSFIRVAESSGLIVEIDRWVLEEAIATLARNPQLPAVAVNLSARSIEAFSRSAIIAELLRQYRVAPARLNVELTETAAVADIEAAQMFIESLRQLGCMTGLDDFGTGFSSFAYLLRLKVDYVKIDGIFIQDLTRNEESRVLVQSMVDVSHGLHKLAVAEFVEDGETAALLAEMGVDLFQGHHFAEPQDDVTQLLAPSSK